MIIERYIIRNSIGPFFFSMSVITFVFIMDFILRYIDLFLGKGVEFSIVLQTFILSLGHMFALIIPMAVLPATLMTFGNLAAENEITALKSSGISMYRMIVPGVIAATFLAGALIAYNNYVLPESNHKLLSLLIDINRKKPTVEIRPNQSIDALQGYTFIVREKNDKTGEIRDIRIYREHLKGQAPTIIVAESGRLKYLEGENVLQFDLENGEIHEMPAGSNWGRYRRTEFEQYTMNIKDIDRSLQRTERKQRGDREMSVPMMQDRVAELNENMRESEDRIKRVATERMERTFRLLDPAYRKAVYGPRDSTAAAAVQSAKPDPRLRARGGTRNAPPGARNEYITRQDIETEINKRKSSVRQINRYHVEIHKKFSIPFACLIFVLVGSPIAIRTGRSGMNTAIGLSILFFLVYYVCLIGGEKLADRGYVSPFASMWSPNLVFGIIALVLLRQAAKEQTVEWHLPKPFKMIFRRDATANTR